MWRNGSMPISHSVQKHPDLNLSRELKLFTPQKSIDSVGAFFAKILFHQKIIY